MARSRKNNGASKPADDSTKPAAPKTDAVPDVEDAEILEEIPADEGPKSQPVETDEVPTDPETKAEEAETSKDAPSDLSDGGEIDNPDASEVLDELPTDRAESELAKASDGEQPPVEDASENDQTGMEPEAKPAADAEPAARELSLMPFFIAAVGGGIIAALLGFVAARQLDLANTPEGPTPSDNAAALAAVETRLQSLDTTLAEVAARDMQAVADAAVSPVTSGLSDSNATIAALSDQISALAERVETIAMRPTATGIEADEFDAALGEFREQLNAAISNAQTEIEAARAEAARISDEAYSAEQAALARAAWGQVTTALESGTSYSEPLATLSELNGTEIPSALSDSAQDGIPTLASLQQAFPDAARDALEAAIRSETGETPIDRLTSFLRVQSGVRSLSPREGSDPDAVLSRVEGALRNGDLATALQELETLEGPGREALAEWEATARARIAAIEAADAVSGQLNSN